MADDLTDITSALRGINRPQLGALELMRKAADHIDALAGRIAALEAALTKIACYPEGPVSGSMDEPYAAEIARAALEADR